MSDREKSFVADVLRSEGLVSQRGEDTPQISLVHDPPHLPPALLLWIGQEIAFLSPMCTPKDSLKRICWSHLQIGEWMRVRGRSSGPPDWQCPDTEDLHNTIF